MTRRNLIAPAVAVMAAFALACISGSEKEPSIATVSSPLFFKGFGPESLAVQGAKVPEIHRSWNFNTASLRGSYEFHGVLTFDGERGTTADVLKAIDKSVNAVTRFSGIEGVDPNMKLSGKFPVPDSLRNDGDHPIWSMWRYNWKNRHGEIHVWLFPFPNGDIGFAVHHLEEPLVGGPID